MKNKSLKTRLKEARASLREKKKNGEPIPDPMKEWSRDSLESLKKALSGGK